MNIHKILRNTILGAIFIIPFIPFYVSNSLFFPFITGKNFLFRILVEIMFVAWAYLAFHDPSYRPKKNILFYGLSVFLGIIFIADLFGANFMRSFWSNFERMEGFMTLLHLFGYFLVASLVFQTEKLWQRFFQTSIVASVLMCFYGLFQLFGSFAIHQGSSRLDATLGNATYLAVYLLFHIFLTLFLLLRSQDKKWLKISYGVILFLQLYVLYYTATRGAILGLLLGVTLALALVVLFEKQNVKTRKFSAGILVAILLLLGLFSVFRNARFFQESPVLSRFSSISAEDSGTKARFLVWNMALQGLKENPVLGWGQENFNLVFNKYYDPKMYAQEQWFDRTHNVVLDWTISAGLLGMFSYLSIFVFSLYLVWRKIPSFSIVDKSILTGLFAGYFFQNLFVFDNIASYILFFSVLAFLSSLSEKDTSKTTGEPYRVSDSLSNVILPAFIVLLCLGLYFFNIRHILASTDLISALSPQPAGLSANLASFKSALSRGYLGRAEMREQLIQAIPKIAGATAPDNLKNEFFFVAKEEMDKQISENRADARYQLFMGSMLDQVGMFAQAFPYLKEAEVQSPRKQQIAFELGANLINQQKYGEASEEMRRAFELEPAYDEARLLYASSAIYAGKSDVAKKVLVEKFGTYLVPDRRLANAYFSTKQYENAIGVVKALIKANPLDYDAYLSLAASLRALGQKNLAIKQIEFVIEKNPAFKEQGENYIKEILSGN